MAARFWFEKVQEADLEATRRNATMSEVARRTGNKRWTPGKREEASQRLKEAWEKDKPGRMANMQRTQGNALRELRIKLGWSQKQMGEALGFKSNPQNKVCTLEQRTGLRPNIIARAETIAIQHGLNHAPLRSLRMKQKRRQEHNDSVM